MKVLLCILGTMYLLGGLNAIRKGNRKQAVYQLFWALAVAGVLLFCGCQIVGQRFYDQSTGKWYYKPEGIAFRSFGGSE